MPSPRMSRDQVRRARNRGQRRHARARAKSRRNALILVPVLALAAFGAYSALEGPINEQISKPKAAPDPGKRETLAPKKPPKAKPVTIEDVKKWALAFKRRREAWEKTRETSKLSFSDALRILGSVAYTIQGLERVTMRGEESLARWRVEELEKLAREWDARLAGKGIDWDKLDDKR